MLIPRTPALQEIHQRFQHSPCVAILGPRQCGKTTLSRQYADNQKGRNVTFFDLEDPAHLAQLDNPMLALESLRGLVIIDEIQRRPELFPALRVLIDRNEVVQFLILGSASRDLIAQSSESLAGRISYIELGGFHTGLISPEEHKKLWHRGGFPRSYLATDDQASFQWRKDFIQTFLERDIPQLGSRIAASALHRFLMMLAHFHGKIFDSSAIAQSLGVAHTTSRKYLDLLTDAYIVRQLQPWFYNSKKRIVKRPKVFFRDTGLLHTLLSIVDEGVLRTHPALGFSWEGFALEQIAQALSLSSEECFFWGLHSGAELDLYFQRNGRAWGVEVKYRDAPRMTRAMHSALEELQLEHLWVVYPGSRIYALSDAVTAIPLQNCLEIREMFSA